MADDDTTTTAALLSFAAINATFSNTASDSPFLSPEVDNLTNAVLAGDPDFTAAIQYHASAPAPPPSPLLLPRASALGKLKAIKRPPPRCSPPRHSPPRCSLHRRSVYSLSPSPLPTADTQEEEGEGEEGVARAPLLREQSKTQLCKPNVTSQSVWDSADINRKRVLSHVGRIVDTDAGVEVDDVERCEHCQHKGHLAICHVYTSDQRAAWHANGGFACAACRFAGKSCSFSAGAGAGNGAQPRRKTMASVDAENKQLRAEVKRLTVELAGAQRSIAAYQEEEGGFGGFE